MPIMEIKTTLCTNCNACVEACPMDVLRSSEQRTPVIAYAEDCQSCYLCAITCPSGAVVVTPDRARPTPLPF